MSLIEAFAFFLRMLIWFYGVSCHRARFDDCSWKYTQKKMHMLHCGSHLRKDLASASFELFQAFGLVASLCGRGSPGQSLL